MTNDEARVRALLDDLSRSIRDKNAAGAIATLAENAVAFDLAPPLRVGPEATRDPAWYEEWFATWKSPIGSQSHDLEVIVGGDVAYAYGLQHMTGTKTDGQEVDLWFRATACFRRENGQWRILPIAAAGSTSIGIGLLHRTRRCRSSKWAPARPRYSRCLGRSFRASWCRSISSYTRSCSCNCGRRQHRAAVIG